MLTLNHEVIPKFYQKDVMSEEHSFTARVADGSQTSAIYVFKEEVFCFTDYISLKH